MTRKNGKEKNEKSEKEEKCKEIHNEAGIKNI